MPKDEHHFKETSYHMDRPGQLNKINESEGVHMTLKELCVFSHDMENKHPTTLPASTE